MSATLILVGGWVGSVPTGGGGGGLTVQDVIDALAAYDAATGADISALGASASLTIVNAVIGSTITVTRSDTWRFTVTGAQALTNYETLAFVVKSDYSQADAAALAYLRSDVGLVAMNGVAAGSPTAGDLTAGANDFTVLIDIDQTNVAPGNYIWALKGFDTTPAPDEGYTLVTGRFVVREYVVRAVA